MYRFGLYYRARIMHKAANVSWPLKQRFIIERFISELLKPMKCNIVRIMVSGSLPAPCCPRNKNNIISFEQPVDVLKSELVVLFRQVLTSHKAKYNVAVEHPEIVRPLQSAAAGYNNRGLLQLHPAAGLCNGFQNLYAIITGIRPGLSCDNMTDAFFGMHGLHDPGPHGCHLGPMMRGNNGSHDIAAESRAGLQQTTILR